MPTRSALKEGGAIDICPLGYRHCIVLLPHRTRFYTARPDGGPPFRTGLSIVFIAVAYAVANIFSVREDVERSYDHVNGIAVNRSEQLLALSLDNDPDANPIVARVHDAERVANMVRSHQGLAQPGRSVVVVGSPCNGSAASSATLL